eukprot:CAMPEP_0169323272 /NCGR_PEP_ID=MMETSP1017-20121227/9860_1 /TAXON_ID=342587 /ORGANISM="Karlodinium micrum, Strain CCMP2283" /LENGTH=104 /DNA_ID=CAMNT_0009417861 /DNA_START=998 /DNA_END=1312 /DNA_ORIENTATION=-
MSRAPPRQWATHGAEEPTVHQLLFLEPNSCQQARGRVEEGEERRRSLPSLPLTQTASLPPRMGRCESHSLAAAWAIKNNKRNVWVLSERQRGIHSDIQGRPTDE